MACFLVPAAEAVVVTAVALTLKKKEEKLTLPAHLCRRPKGWPYI